MIWPAVLFLGRIHRKNKVSIPRIERAKTRLPKPLELRVERRTSIVLLPLDRGRQVGLTCSRVARGLFPFLISATLELLALGENHLRIDEDPVAIECIVDAAEERAFLVVLEMMNRQRRNDRVKLSRNWILAVIEQDETRAILDFLALKFLARQLQHLGRDIGENNCRAWKRVCNERRQHSGSGAKIQHRELAISLEWDLRDRGAIQIVVTWNHAAAAAIVDLGIVVKGVFHRVM